MEVVEEPVGRASFRSLAAIPGARRERALEQVPYREAARGGALFCVSSEGRRKLAPGNPQLSA